MPSTFFLLVLKLYTGVIETWLLFETVVYLTTFCVENSFFAVFPSFQASLLSLYKLVLKLYSELTVAK